uniref:DNA-directed RNA polymerases I and III subunit RPAC2 n=1 Tax=Eubosmina coregoni TaxID=186181 RepID=A0A4Y7LS97_9CRUS|nr:EOG090X0LBP [Eubosmina coregoni]
MPEPTEHRKLSVLREDEENDSNKTFIFEGEGHTLGNALKMLLLKNPEVNFCGYTIPHPSEDKLHLRIEMLSNTSPADVLRKALEDLEKVCTHISDKFEEAVKEYKDSSMV